MKEKYEQGDEIRLKNYPLITGVFACYFGPFNSRCYIIRHGDEHLGPLVYEIHEIEKVPK